MIEKMLTWIANVVLACVLVVVASSPNVFAQQNDGTEVVDGPESLVIELSGTAVLKTEGNLTVSPTRFDTGLLDIGQTTQQSVVLTHDGDLDSPPIEITEVNLFGVHVDEYFTDFNGFTTLFPGDSVQVNITFTPIEPGKKNAGLRLNVSGASAPHIVLIDGHARYPLTSDLIVNDSDIDLGSTIVSKNKSSNVTLTNIAQEADAPVIAVQSVSLSGDTPEAFTTNFTPKTLGPGQSMTFNATMNSPQEGHKSAKLTIEHTGFNNAVVVNLDGDVNEPTSVPVNFSLSSLSGANIDRGTTIQFGPDGKLYVGEMDGAIKIYNVQRNGKNNYQATLDQTINSIKNMPNRDDDGDINNSINGRLVTGILVVGTAVKPVIYLQSSDPRQGAGPSGIDKNLDTNSGILHRLTKNGNGWIKDDLVRGLPRSEENHQGNGMAMLGNKLLMSSGGFTNMGAPSNNFAEITEYALSGAILEFDLNALGNGTYDLPTLDDEDRPGGNDANDPFGGNDGKNQAKLVNNGPVKIYAPGFRNAYDLVLTEAGRLYTVDNGPNAGWGNVPVGNCTNNLADGGFTHKDNLHYISQKGYYGGHPNPTRGNKNNTFNANSQTPIEGNANAVECNYKIPGQQDGALTIFDKSTNGIDEYTASNFSGQMEGNLVMASFNKSVFRVQLNGAGDQVNSKSELKNGVGTVPLDLTAQGDDGPFPGTIWVVDNSATTIQVLEPSDY